MSNKQESKFVEYWVPVGISGVQLEQYCANLLFNSSSLCSPSKIDLVGSLHCVLKNARKCCDHPYILDRLLQTSLLKFGDVKNILEVGINASGKLKILDMMLSFMKDRGLRAIVLYQTDVRPGSTGDILDDFVRWRFGVDSYERYDGLVVRSKRQTAMKNFNDKEERFIFLLEVQSCTLKIKLSSIDCVVLYSSDWNPMNDIKSLQKLSIDSKSERIIVFRLFLPFTLEERALVLSRQDSSLDSKIQNLSCTANHMLLMWGSSVLFEKLNEFHSNRDVDENSLFEQMRPEKIFQEFSTIVDQNGKEFYFSEDSIIVKVEKCDFYITESLLPGEKKNFPKDDDRPHVFWKRLLDGKQPQWRYEFSFTSDRKRKRVQLVPLDPILSVDEHENERRKLPTDKSHGKADKDKATPACASVPMSPGLSSENTETSQKQHEGKEKFYEQQKNLHTFLKPEIAKLNDLIELPENVKPMVESFLDYVMANHNVPSEPATILQAFQISLCWSASSFLNFKLDRKNSLALARKHLNYCCKKEEADFIFLMLQCLKRVFLLHLEKLGNTSSASNSFSNIMDKDGVEGVQPELEQRDLLKSFQNIEKRFSKLDKKLSNKLLNEKAIISSTHENAKQQFLNKKRAEIAVIRMHCQGSMKLNLLESVEENYAKKLSELESETKGHLQRLEKENHAQVQRLRIKKGNWIDRLTSLAKSLPTENEQNRDSICLSVPNEENVSNSRNTHESLAEMSVINSEAVKLVPKMEAFSDPHFVSGSDDRTENVSVQLTCHSQHSDSMGDDVNAQRVIGGKGVDVESTCALKGIFSSGIPEVRDEPPLVADERRDLGSSQAADSTLTTIMSIAVHTEGASSFPASGIGCDGNTGMIGNLSTPSIHGAPDLNQQDEMQTSCPSTNDKSTDFGCSHAAESNRPLAMGEVDSVSTLSCPNTNLNKGNDLQATNDICNAFLVHSSCELPGNDTNLRTTDCVSSTSFTDVTKVNDLHTVAGVLDAASTKETTWRENGANDLNEIPATRSSHCPDHVPPDYDRNIELSNCESMTFSILSRESAQNVPAGDTDGGRNNLGSLGESNNLRIDNISRVSFPGSIQMNETISTSSNPVPSQSAAFFVDGSSVRLSQADAQHVHARLGPYNQIASLNIPAQMEIPVESYHNPILGDALFPEFHSLRSTQVQVSAMRMANPNPLLSELENILKEKEKVLKSNEDTKTRLKSECEKKIEEEVMKIRRQYETEITEVELFSLSKKKELEAYYEKVLLNMLLAEAFKAKSTRVRSSSTSDSRPDAASGQVRQPHSSATRAPGVRTTSPSGFPDPPHHWQQSSAPSTSSGARPTASPFQQLHQRPLMPASSAVPPVSFGIPHHPNGGGGASTSTTLPSCGTDVNCNALLTNPSAADEVVCLSDDE